MTVLSGNSIVPKSITNSSGNRTINLDLFVNLNCPINNNGYIIVNGVVSGTKSLTFLGTGTTELTNSNNTYNGKILIRSGALKLSGSSTILTRGAGSGNSYLINGVLEHSSSTDLIFNNPIDGAQFLYGVSPNAKIISNGPGKIHFRTPYADNSFDGTLEINSGGYVKIGNNDTIQNGSKGNGTGTIYYCRAMTINAGGTLEFDRNSASSTADISANISGSGPIIVTRSSNINFWGISSHNGTFTINSGTVTYNRQASHQFVNNGTLVLNMSDALYWQTIGDRVFSKTIGASTTSYVQNTDWTLGTSVSGLATAQVQAAGLGNSMTEFSGFVPGRIALVQRGVQTFQTKVNNAIAAGAVGVIIYNNQAGLTTPSLTASIPVIMVTQAIGQQMVTEINSGTVTATLSSGVSAGALAAPIFDNSLTGTGTLAKAGTGTIVVGSNANHSGPTNVTAGALRITGNARLPNSSVSVSSGAAFEILGGSTFSRNISTNGTGISSGGVIRNISGDNTLSGNITQVEASRINSDAGTLTLSNVGTLSGTFGLTFGGAGNILVQRAIATSTGTVTKDGAGTVTFDADNTYTGATTVSAGTLVVGNGGTTGTITSASVASGATLTFNRSNAYAFAGVISGAGRVTKSSSGTTTLSSTNTYTGGTVINGGTLKAGNATCFGTGTITINAGATLDRGGFTITNTIVNNGGTII